MHSGKLVEILHKENELIKRVYLRKSDDVDDVDDVIILLIVIMIIPRVIFVLKMPMLLIKSEIL